jgi:hypothetical protein
MFIKGNPRGEEAIKNVVTGESPAAVNDLSKVPLFVDSAVCKCLRKAQCLANAMHTRQMVSEFSNTTNEGEVVACCRTFIRQSPVLWITRNTTAGEAVVIRSAVGNLIEI